MKKTLSIILAILMLLSVCPVAFAAEDFEITQQPTLSEPTVVTNDEGATYQWYEMEMVMQELTPDEPADDCDHLCHKTGFMGFIWKIVRFFQKLFRINQTCACGVAHW